MHKFGGLKTLIAPLIILATREGMLDARMHDEKSEVSGEGDEINGFRTTVEMDHVIFFPKNRGDLVEESAADADELIFRATAEFGEFERGNFERKQFGQQHCGRDFDCGRTGQSCSRGKIR